MGCQADKVRLLEFIEFLDNKRIVWTALFLEWTGQWRRDEFCKESESVDATLAVA